MTAYSGIYRLRHVGMLSAGPANPSGNDTVSGPSESTCAGDEDDSQEDTPVTPVTPTSSRPHEDVKHDQLQGPNNPNNSDNPDDSVRAGTECHSGDVNVKDSDLVRSTAADRSSDKVEDEEAEEGIPEALRGRTFMLETEFVQLWFCADSQMLRHAWVTNVHVARDQQARFHALQLKRQQQWEIKYEDIQLGPRVGSGAFGVVYKAALWGTPVAVKVCMYIYI